MEREIFMNKNLFLLSNPPFFRPHHRDNEREFPLVLFLVVSHTIHYLQVVPVEYSKKASRGLINKDFSLLKQATSPFPEYSDKCVHYCRYEDEQGLETRKSPEIQKMRGEEDDDEGRVNKD